MSWVTRDRLPSLTKTGRFSAPVFFVGRSELTCITSNRAHRSFDCVLDTLHGAADRPAAPVRANWCGGSAIVVQHRPGARSSATRSKQRRHLDLPPAAGHGGNCIHANLHTQFRYCSPPPDQKLDVAGRRDWHRVGLNRERRKCGSPATDAGRTACCPRRLRRRATMGQLFSEGWDRARRHHQQLDRGMTIARE